MAFSVIFFLLCMTAVNIELKIVESSQEKEVKEYSDANPPSQNWSTPTTSSPATPQCNCVCKYPSNWTSVQKTMIGSSDLDKVVTSTYTIPGIIPSNATEVLVFVGANIHGYTNVGPSTDLKIFTQIGATKYEKYLMLYSSNQATYFSNSENMWFPMPPNRMVYLTVPQAYGGKIAWISFSVIGYR